MKTGTKIAVWIIIIIATAAFLFMGLVVTMMLAPGLEIFGVKYVSAKVGKYKFSNTVSYTSSNIILNTGDVPIEIAFGQSGYLGLEFVQNFQGFTKSADTANVKITNGSGDEYHSGDNTVIFDITEYKKFVWANSMQDFYLKLKLPATYISTGTIKINSSRSDITFKGIEKQFSSLDLQTKGKVDIQNKITLSGDFKISSNSALKLGDNITVDGNVVANMGNEDLTIVNPVGKDITFNSGSGSLNFNTCRNLSATTGSGNINQPTANSISGNLTFNSTSGGVEIDNVSGSQNTVNTRSGFIKLGKVLNGTLEISTLRAPSFVLREVHNANINIEGKSTPVINTVTGNLTVNAQGLTAGVTCAEVFGNATVTIKDGEARFNGTVGGNLTVTKNSGNLIAGVVNGTVKVTANNGQVNIATIKGAQNVINSQHGIVNVETVEKDLKVENATNAVYTIGSVDELNVNPNRLSTFACAINVGAVGTSAKINTNAAVSLGYAGDVADVEISAGRGDVTLKNTVGKVLVASVAHTINLENKYSTDIKLNKYYDSGSGAWKDVTGGSAIVATGLRGSVAVYSVGTIDLTFAAVTDNVDVVSGSGSEKVKINATCIRYNHVNYNLNTQTSGSTCKVWYGETEHTTNPYPSSIENNNTGVEIGIRVRTNGAPIELRLAA